MSKVLIVYATDYGHTQTCAEALARGVESAGGTAMLRAAGDATGDDVRAADALVLGSPSHMGSPDWKIKRFIDEHCSGLWMNNDGIGKVGAVFGTGSGYGNAGGGIELTLLALLNNLAELGMLLVPLPKNTTHYADGGLQWGPYARVHTADTMEPIEVSDAQQAVLTVHGANIARVADRVAGQSLFKP